MSSANGSRNGSRSTSGAEPTVVGLFAGIGGIELGLHRAGFKGRMFCEIDPAAAAVLQHHFPNVPLVPDVRDVGVLPACDVLAAGFPCQDLSMAGPKGGIRGDRSSLVGEVFRLLEATAASPRWLVLENVPYMLHLDRGAGMRFLTQELERLGFAWAYRTVDARSFGIPQRRFRVVLVASREDDPRRVLFRDRADPPPINDDIGPVHNDWAYGFYWTEGKRGLGWAGEAVPTIKGGSGLGIPSPPAIWIPASGELGTPDIRDVERLQGFPVDWTKKATDASRRRGARWTLLGNAVCVPVSEWMARRLKAPGEPSNAWHPLRNGAKWPKAAWGSEGKIFTCEASAYPVRTSPIPLSEFLRYPLKPLSERATRGFLKRARTGTVNFPDGFLESVSEHLERMEGEPVSK